MLQIQNLSKNYGSTIALSEVSFSIEKGTILGLLGVNGAGKSTLLKILATIISADGGAVLYKDVEIQQGNNSYKEKLGYLSEENPLYDEMYVLEYLEYIAGIYNVKKAQITLIIDKLGLQEQVTKKIKALSKGNKQRVGIAQALLHESEILIFDEATSGLDPKQRESFLDILREISHDKIIIFSSHILQEVKAICNRFILIDRGRLLADEDISNITSIEERFHALIKE